MKKTSIVVGLLVVALGGVPSPAQGQGWYLGSELGAHVVPALGITGLSNDRASVCDEFINPQYATVTQTAGYEAYNCAGPDRRDNWVNQFARATGLQASWVLGVSLRGRRLWPAVAPRADGDGILLPRHRLRPDRRRAPASALARAASPPTS